MVGAPQGYTSWLEALPEGVSFSPRLSKKTALVHLFVTERSELARALVRFRKGLDPSGVVWVSWPKKAAKVPTDLTEDVIRAEALPLGFVDVKVCAVTEVWSGLKLVVRKELRAK